MTHSGARPALASVEVDKTLIFMAWILGWILLQQFVLPRLGVPT